jgi:hypothetical protein
VPVVDGPRSPLGRAFGSAGGILGRCFAECSGSIVPLGQATIELLAFQKAPVCGYAGRDLFEVRSCRRGPDAALAALRRKAVPPADRSASGTHACSLSLPRP